MTTITTHTPTAVQPFSSSHHAESLPTAPAAIVEDPAVLAPIPEPPGASTSSAPTPPQGASTTPSSTTAPAVMPSATAAAPPRGTVTTTPAVTPPPLTASDIVHASDVDGTALDLDTPLDPAAVLELLDPQARATLETMLPVFLSGDPLIMSAALASALRMENHETQETTVGIETAADERAVEEQNEARRRARSASRRAGRFLGRAPKWLKKLITSVIVAASAAATALTGGAAAGLAIAGAILILGADLIKKVAIELGMSERNASFLALGCQIAGAALMLGAGAAGAASSTASTASEAVRTTQTVLRTITKSINAGVQLEEGVRNVGVTVANRQVADANIDGAHAGIESDRAQDALASVIDAMRETASRYQRVLAILEETMDARHQAQSALIQRMA